MIGTINGKDYPKSITLKPSHDIITRNANNFNSLTCNTNTFLHSFLIRTARELRTGNIIVD